MTSRLITKPVRLAVSLADAKLSLRIEPDMTELDDLLDLWIRGVTREAEHYLGRALISQKWRVTLGAASGRIMLANPPLIDVDSVKYYDENHELQALPLALYQVNKASEPAFIEPVAGGAWPALHSRADSFMVDYTCGYGTDESSIPEDVQLYILARVCEQWDPATRAFTATAQSEYMRGLLDGCKVYS